MKNYKEKLIAIGKTNIYLKAAELLFKNKEFHYRFDGACCAISHAADRYNTDDIESCAFGDHFRPTASEKKKFSIFEHTVFWLWSEDRTDDENLNDRIFALLLMNEIVNNPCWK